MKKRFFCGLCGITVSLFIGLLSMTSGCQAPAAPPEPGVPPIANAGANQTVPTKTEVTLDGTGSTDPNGSPLTYQWIQTGGTPVTLSGDNTPKPTFTSPTSSTTLTFELTVTNNQDLSDSDTMTVTVTNPGETLNVEGGDKITLSCSSQSQSESNLTFNWTQTSGPQVILINPTSPNPVFVAPNVTTVVTFQVVITNIQNISTTEIVTVDIVAVDENLPPTANAGQPQTVTTGSTVTLNGSASSDPQGQTLTYAWIQTSGTAVTINGANTVKPTFVAPNTAGNLTFQLTVTNTQKLSDSDSVTIQVVEPNNVPPVANAGPDQNVTSGDTVTLDGSASSDPNNSTLTYAWTQTAGTAVTLTGANAAKPTFVAPNTAETLTFQLTVTNTAGLSSQDTTNVTVSNAQPIANAGPDQTVDGGATVTLNGSTSSDPQGQPLTYAWTQTAGTAVTLSDPNSATPTFVAPNTVEKLTFELKVTNTAGLSSQDTTEVTINNTPPIANAGPDQTVSGGATVTLDGSGSSDPQGQTLTYAWTQTSGTAVTLTGSNTAKPTFTAPGDVETLTFELTVTDTLGLSAKATTNVSISNAVPVADAGPDQNVDSGDTVTLDGSASSDPDNDTLTYAWTQTAGTAVTLSDPNSPAPTFTAPNTTETLTFQLTVEDGKGGSNSDSVDISVQSP